MKLLVLVLGSLLSLSLSVGCGSNPKEERPSPDPDGITPEYPGSGGAVQGGGEADAGGVPAGPKNVIIIGWDGVQRDHIKQCMDRKIPECPDGLPNLVALGRGYAKAFVKFDVTTAATCTKPGWTEILTGYNSESLGILDNKQFKAVPAGYSVLEKVEAHFGKDKTASLFITGKPAHVDDQCDTVPQKPWCEVSKNIDFYQKDLGENAAVGQKALALLEEYKDREHIIALFHFENPDHMGHQHGENSAEYSSALVEEDQWLGKILEKLKAQGKEQETLVYVVTDHGFDEGKTSHNNAPYGFLVSNDGQILRGGDRKDLVPTILKRLGVSREAQGSIPAVHGEALDETPTACVKAGEVYYHVANYPACCAGLTLIGLDKETSTGCLTPTGGTGDMTGYCTRCGDGVCGKRENPCNCPEDCM